MRPKSSIPKKPAAQVVKDIRRQTCRHFWAEDKIRIVLEGLRGEDNIADTVPEGRRCPELVLHLVQGVHGGWQAPAGR